MPRPEFRKSEVRRRPSPIVELLEGRHLLNATAVTKHLSLDVHAEVVKATTEQTKLVKQEKVQEAKLVKQEKVQEAKQAKLEKASQAKLAKQEKTALIKLTKQANSATKSSKQVVLQKATPIKISNKLVDLVGIQGPSNPQSVGSGVGQVTYSPVVGAYTPIQLETAYGVNQLGTANQGQGETIAIVDELNDTSIISDANVYSAQYGLPQFNTAGGPTMTVDLDSNLAAVGSAAGSGVGDETSLDVELAHAMAPQANILLVEVPATGNVANEFAELLEGVQYAVKQSPTQGGPLTTPVVAVSLSYGYAEASIGATNVKNQDATYLAPGTVASTVAVTVSTGDASSPLFPATTPDVVAVGGTGLYLNSARGRYGYEEAWGGLAGAGAGGGGLSTNFASPTFQSANGVNFAKRAIPDISMEADDVTAVSVYDSFDAGTGSPWVAYGGTSVAAPLTAGVISLAQQDRIAAGLPILNSVQFDTAIYEAYNSPAYTTYFHDITLGKNSNVNSSGRTTVAGFSAVTGYDEATGIGSPIANALVPYLTTYVIGS